MVTYRGLMPVLIQKGIKQGIHLFTCTQQQFLPKVASLAARTSCLLLLVWQRRCIGGWEAEAITYAEFRSLSCILNYCGALQDKTVNHGHLIEHRHGHGPQRMVRYLNTGLVA